MRDVQEWFLSLPSITRHWFLGAIVFPLLVRFEVIDAYRIILLWDPLVYQFELWRPFTSVLYYSVGFGWLVKLYFLVTYSRKLEQEHYASRPGTYAFLLFVNWIGCVTLGLCFQYPILLGPMINSVVYIWCQLNPNIVIQFWFGTEFKAKIFPVILVVMDFILYNDWKAQAIGIASGHMYYFLTTDWARTHGQPLITTPNFFRHFFHPRRGYQSVVQGVYMEDYRDTGPSPVAPSSYSFPGTGRVLADDN